MVMGNKRARNVSDEEVIGVYRAQQSAAKTAQITGISQTTIYRILERHGVPRTDPAELYERRARFHAEKALIIRREYEAGATFADLVRKHGGTEYSIKRAIRTAGGSLLPVTPALTGTEKLEILKLTEQGVSQMKISLQLGRSQASVTRFLRSVGIHRRVGGESHGRWKGGRLKSQGYWKVKVDADDPVASSMRDCHGYVLEHRLAMARKLDRPLLRSETVHHINGDKTDNRLENLQLRQGKHGKHIVMHCLDCGSHNIGPAPLADALP